MKVKPLPFIITFAVGIVISGVAFLIIALADSAISLNSTSSVLGALADAFTVSGVILFGVGCIAFANRKGTFDALGYSVESVLVVRNLSPKRRFKERENFAEYRERKTEERKKKSGIAHYFIVGLIFIIIAVGFIIAYSVI